MLYEFNYPVQIPALTTQPPMLGAMVPAQVRDLLARRPVARPHDESTAVAAFVSWIDSLGSLSNASPELRARVLREVQRLARHVNGSAEVGAPTGYDRRVLYEDHDRWSIAAVILRSGQYTECHDHGGWGCAVTVQGVERNRRFAPDASGSLAPVDELDYPPGTGYVFDASEVHQPLGADPRSVTVALHFLVHEGHAGAHAELRAA